MSTNPHEQEAISVIGERISAYCEAGQKFILRNNEHERGVLEQQIEFLKQLSQGLKSGESRVSICDSDFYVGKHALGFGSKYGGVKVLAPTSETPVNDHWQIRMAVSHGQSFRNAGQMFEISHNPNCVVVFLPRDFKVSGQSIADNWGWGQDAGVVMLNTPLISKLAGRDGGSYGMAGSHGGHHDHEGVHCVIEAAFPDLYHALLRPNPHIDEMFALAGETLMTPVFKGRKSSEPARNRFLGLNFGMAQEYMVQMNMVDFYNLLSFKQLDGEKFEEGLYPQRWLLGLFAATLAMGTLQGAPVEDRGFYHWDFPENHLKVGLTRLHDITQEENEAGVIGCRQLGSALKSLASINPDEVTEGDLWKELAGTRDLSLIESKYKQYAPLILAAWNLFPIKDPILRENIAQGFKSGIRATVAHLAACLRVTDPIEESAKLSLEYTRSLQLKRNQRRLRRSL